MKKRLLSAVLAVCMLFGFAAAMPEGFLGDSASITASAETSQGYNYSELTDGTVQITGIDSNTAEGATLLEADTINVPSKLGGKTVTFVKKLRPTLKKNLVLKKVVFPSTVITIGDGLFRYHQALTTVQLSEGLKVIGKAVFDGCYALETITIPKSVTDIGTNAFNDCTALKSITVTSGSTSFASVDGVLYNAAKTVMYCCPMGKTSVNIPGTVQTIPSMAFSANLTSVTLNNGTKTMDKWAFINCKNMKSITIPASVTTINSQAVGYYHANGESTDPETKITGFVIKGYTGSAAQTYAKNNGFEFQSLGIVCSHTYGSPTWAWSGTSSANATFTCSKCGDNEPAAATITSSVTKAATCSAKGTRTYTAKVTFNNTNYTSEKTADIAIDPDAHTWSTTPTWTWSSDFKSATATFTCKNNSNHTKTANASSITGKVTKAATCNSTGTKTYTAKVTIDGKTYTGTATETTPVDADAHVWGTTPSWLWEKDYKSATLVLTCENNAAHSTNVPATVSTKTTAESCTEAGKTVYTASASYGGKTYTDKREVSIAALGHNYIDSVTSPSCTTQGYTTHTCQRCKDSYIDAYTNPLGHNWEKWTTTDQPTCTADGKQESSCTRCSEKTTRKVDMLGHDYVTSVVEPTCTESGYTLHKCSRCKDYYKTDEKAAKGHNWVIWTTTTEPTCTADGEQKSSCTRCSEKTTRKVTKLGHNYVTTVVAPTCTEKGYTLHKCSRCDDYYKTDETPITSHKYKETVVTPTCSERGYTLYTCTDCGYSYKGNYTDKSAHSWGMWTVEKEPTCIAAGTKNRKCSACGEVQSGAVEALGHDYKATVSAPNCTAQGFTMYTCTRCKDSYKSDYTDALGHDYGYWQVTVQPTCTQTGEQTRSCLRCKAVDNAPVAAMGHNYSSSTVMPTCTEQGYTQHTCTRCSDYYVDGYTDALGHEWKTWVRTAEPTCLEDGEESSTCTRCKVKTTRTVNKLGHNYKSTVIAPTCTEKGYTLNKCSRCDNYYKNNEKAALGHSWSAWTTVTAANCTNDGTQKHICTRSGCTASETRTVSKLGHKYSGVTTQPTCTEKGFTTYTCSRCKDSYVDDYTDALGHSFGNWKTTKKETCTTDGSEKRTCTRTGCTESESRVRKMLGHDIVDTVVAPTCTEQGYTRHQCSRCTENYTDTYTDAKGHNWGQWQTTTAATYTQEGEQQRKCKNCTAVEKKVIPMLGHHYKQTVTAPTCTQRGYTTFRCTDCGDNYVANYVEPLGHSYKADRVVAPTCTEKGYTIEKCERCGQTRNENYTDELGHSFGKWQTTTPASCTTNGVKTRKCTRTGCKASETDVIVSSGHKYKEKVIAPTCTVNGCTEYTCSVCNHSYQDTVVEALGHNFGDWETVKPATCLEDGTKRRTCKRKNCGYVQTETIRMLGHNYKSTVVAPTCTEEGYTLKSCTRCTDFYRSNITKAKGHTFGSWSTKVAATCENEGTETRTCLVCKETETKAIAKLAHDYTSVVKAATCTEMGHTTYTCTRCKASYDDNYTNALGHNWGSWKKTVAPTCEAGGTQTRKCTRCTETQSSTLSALGHDFVKKKTVKPTCTEKGYSVYTCSRCQSSRNDDYVDAPGHKFGKLTTVEATVTKQGSNTRTCSVCSQKETTVLPKLSIRVYGSSRYDTAFQIADRIKKENGGKAFKCVIIASGTDYADALSASYLSKVKGNAPILITNKKLNQDVADYIRKNAASKATVYIVGGTGAVTADMEKKLVGFTVKRLAGSNRYGTNLEVLKEAGVSGGEILIASGGGYADALSASAVGKPIMLVAGKKLTNDQKNYLQKTARCTSATVIGGTGAVKTELEKDVKSVIKSVSRLGGASRYETSVMVARKYFSKPATISLAYGLNYPDGLCGGPLAMTYNCPLILTTDKTLDAAKKYASEIKATNTVTFGGPALISDKSLGTILGK